MSDHLVEGRGIQVLYDGRRVLDVPEIGVRQAQTLAVIGPNGAGKSTLLRVLGLLERPTHGQILLGGNPVERDSNLLALRRRFASVFQDPLLIDGTVERNVGLGLQLRRMARSDIKERTGRWMQRLGIAGLATRQARSLSGGEAQRVSLARAFAIEPDILLLDEPFAALDPPTRETLFRDLQRVLRDCRITTIFVTHARREAMRLGDRVAVLIKGRCEQVGAPEEVFNHPVSASVARFVGIENLLTGRVTEQHDGLLTIDTGSVRIRAPGRVSIGSLVVVCLRPENLVLHFGVQAESHDGVSNRLPGRITEVLPTGLHYRVELDCGHQLVALVSKHCVQDLHLAPSANVCVSFRPSAAHIIVG